MFRAGVAVRDITPKGKCLTSGYPIPADRSAEIAHDPLLASAFYFENNGQKAIFFCTDVINMTKDRCNELRMLVEKHTGISRANSPRALSAAFSTAGCRSFWSRA